MPRALPHAVVVRVPASSANLGPGYDVLGIAWRLYNRFTLERANLVEVRVAGPEAGDLPADASNLVLESAARVFRLLGHPVPALRLKAHIAIPMARGLGSSSTAIVGGVVAANGLLGSPLDRERLLAIATDIEGHPDNVAPALLGGLTAALRTPAGKVLVSRRLASRRLDYVVLSPAYGVPTKKARAALPAKIPHADAVYNLARIPLLLDRLATGSTEDLAELAGDRLHEGYRAGLFRGFEALRAAALAGGAAAVCLSGAGPSMLAIGNRGAAAGIAQAWNSALRKLELGGRVRILRPDTDGALCVPRVTPRTGRVV